MLKSSRSDQRQESSAGTYSRRLRDLLRLRFIPDRGVDITVVSLLNLTFFGEKRRIRTWPLSSPSVQSRKLPFIITEDEKLAIRSALFCVHPHLHPLHTGTGHRNPEHQPELRVLRAQPDGWSHTGGRGLTGGGEETHSEPVTDAGQTQHHPPHPEGGDGDRAQEAPRREGARRWEGGDPQPGRTRRVHERGGGGDVGDHQLRRDRCVCGGSACVRARSYD